MEALGIALAGGTGAFLGAAVGQAIQWAPEIQTENRVDRRRAEDAAREASRERRARRYEEYMQVLKFVQEVHRKLELLGDVGQITSGSEDFRPPILEALANLKRDVGQALLTGLDAATATAFVVGTVELQVHMRTLNSHAVGYISAYELTNKMTQFVQPDGLAEFQRRRDSGEGVNVFSFMEEVEVPWAAVVAGLNVGTDTTLQLVSKIRELLRLELDIT